MQETKFAPDKSLSAVLDAVARELVSVDHRPDGAFISTPLLYPSGSTVVVKIERIGTDEYFISDYGLAFLECDMMGATSIFRRHAKAIAENAGVGFDSHSFFVLKVSRGQLTGAIAAVANCSLEAVSVTALKLSEKRFADEALLLHQRLVAIFTEKHVSKDVDIIGASHTSWHFSSVVRTDKGDREVSTIFEPVTKHHASIATAVTKFHDVARLDSPPGRVAVVRKKADFGTYLEVLAQAANVISRDVPDTTFQRLAA